MQRSVDVPLVVLLLAAHVHDQRVLGRGRVIFGVPQRDVAAQQVAGDEPGHVDRVLGRAVGRRVGQLQALQVEHGHLGAQGGR